jgi:dolichol-phosphate mannosyltransferase
MGQSKALLTGIIKSKYNTIITLDGDGQNNPNDIRKLMEIYFNSNYFLVGGIRLNRKDNFVKNISSKLANFIRQLVLKDECIDTGCSLKIFDKKIFLNFPFFNGIHRFLPALFKGYNKETCFIEVDHRQRNAGVSKYGTFDRLFVGIRDIIKVRNIIINNKKSNV